MSHLMSEHTVQNIKHGVDGAAIAAWLAHVAGWISVGIVPVLTMIWLILRIWETETVQSWRERRKQKKKIEEEEEGQ